MSEAERLRAKAQRCRRFADKYADQVSPSLGKLAIELEKRADALDAPGKANLSDLFGR